MPAHIERKLSTLKECSIVAEELSKFFPNPDTSELGIIEIIINAHEHGNLSITYDEKTALNKDMSWVEEVERREKLPENKDKSVHIELIIIDECILIVVKDEGSGFDPKRYIEISQHRITDTHGRGIAIAKAMSFKELHFKEGGTIAAGIVCNGKRKDIKACKDCPYFNKVYDLSKIINT